ncbi:MAG: DUF3187 family protein [Candidatus Alcyoniella australis]|nr:DUF3187 family protein [Candidatus Alcyoniella australis]
MRNVLFTILIAFSLLVALPAGAADVQYPLDGPLLVRHQGIAHLPHMLLLPRSGRVAQQQTALRATLTHANHWGWQGGPQPNYRIDLETTVLDLYGSLALGRHMELGLDIPMLWHKGGSMDAAIMRFHSAFGIDQEHRSRYPRNDQELWVAPRGKRTELLNEGSPWALPLNPSLCLTLALLDRMPVGPALALTVGSSLPLALGGSCYFRPPWFEPQLGLALSWQYKRFAMHLNAAYTHIGRERNLAGIRLRRGLSSLLLAPQLALSKSCTLSVQLIYDSPAFEDFGDMGNAGLLLAAGLRFTLAQGCSLELGAVENLMWFDATPDLSLFCGIKITGGR